MVNKELKEVNEPFLGIFRGLVDEVLEETEVKAEVPVSTAANEPTVYEKYKAAFDMDGFDFKTHR